MKSRSMKISLTFKKRDITENHFHFSLREPHISAVDTFCLIFLLMF